MEEQLEISKRGVTKVAVNLTSKDLLIDYMEFILGNSPSFSRIDALSYMRHYVPTLIYVPYVP